MNVSFCRDNFWDKKLFNNRQYPIFTECFQYTLLLIPTLFFLFLFFPWLILRRFIYSTRIVKVPCDHWYMLKMAWQIMLIILLIMEISLERNYLKTEERIDGIYILSYFGLCVCLIFTFILTELRRRMMHPICPILFTFWLLATLTYLLRFYSNIGRLALYSNRYTSIGILVLSGVIMFLFLVSFISDCFPRYTELRSVLKKQKPCPEEYASILSKLTYFWLDKHIYRWYKNDMTEETSFDLRRDDEATRNTDFVEKVFLAKMKDKETIFRSYQPQMDATCTTNLLLPTTNTHDDTPSSLNPGLTLFISLIKVFCPELLIAWLYKIIQDILLFVMPFLLKVLLQYVSDVNNPPWQGYCLSVIFFITGTVSSITINQSFFIASNLSVRVRAALIGIVYRKTLRLSSEVRNKFTSGEIVNLMSVDAERIMQWVAFSWFIVSSPVQITIALVFLYTELGVSVFAGVGLILAFFPLNAVVIKFTQTFSELELQWKDKRVKILTEILNGIKVLKMYAWEPSFNCKVNKLREQEVKYIRNVSIGWGTISVFWDLVPFFVMLVTFITYVYSDDTNIVTADKAFVSLALFNLLRFPMIILPFGITESVNAFVSIRRIGRYLVGEEINLKGINYLNDTMGEKSPDDIVLEIKDGSFKWKKDDKTILKNINMGIGRGKFVAIVGKVGTGKSSLLSSILGEMVKENGSIKVKGRMAYVPQEAWIQNKSLRDNILFTQPYNETFYNDVVEACCLIPDFKQLPAEDRTEIGERGINLSGGQKQRVSLARAVYQNNDIYLLDDPLSAVDAHVGQHLFEKVISSKGLLRDKTRILVTHGLHWLPKVDEVIVLNSNGEISERGSFQELVNSGKEFRRFVQEFMHQNFLATQGVKSETDTEDSIEFKAEEFLRQISENPNVMDELEDIVIHTPPKSPLIRSPEWQSSGEHEFRRRKKSSESFGWRSKIIEASSPDHFGEEPAAVASGRSERSKLHQSSEMGLETASRISVDNNLGQLIDDEQTMTGTVSWGTYRMYFMTRGSIIFSLTILTYALFAAIQVYGNIWLENFTSDAIIKNASDMIAKNTSYRNSSVATIRARTDFYMRIYGLIGLGQAVAVVLFWIGFTIGNVKASQRIHVILLNAILRSPMSFFDTTPSGRTLNRFSKDMDLIDHIVTMNISDTINCLFIVVSSVIVIIIVTPWFAIVIVPVIVLYYFIQLFYMPSTRQSRRLDSVAASPVFNHFTETLQGCAVIRAFSQQSKFQKINQTLIDRSSKYKFIQFASCRWLSLRLDTLGNLMVFGAVLFAVIDRQYITASMIGLSVSYSLQITEFLNWMLQRFTELETNAVAIERIREYSMVPSEASWESKTQLSPDWPDKGNVSFVGLSFRYREGLPMVLKEIDLNLTGGQKIGVVGRTGAGKSSLNLALFRLVEPAEGTIIIDNVDIKTLGLHDLRERLTILPQDPIIFSGTLRENLDPFEKHTDGELFESLERSHLREWVSTLNEGLDYECGEGGVNLSTGQKQLLCLARAILRKSKVLILDEATASVDVETDRLVMQTVRQQFSDSTVIIIAHRINTIMDTDKIVVLDQGRVVEYGTPQELLAKPGGVFKALSEQTHQNDL